MLLTEVEAKKIKCHSAPPAVAQGPMGQVQLIQPQCQGSGCMAWRFTVHTRRENNEDRPRGFCGSVQCGPNEADVEFNPNPAPTSGLVSAR